MEDFWDRVYEMMKASGYTAVDLSKKIGKNPRAIESWKNHGSEPRLSDAFKMAKHLGVSLEEFLTGKKPGPLVTGFADERIASTVTVPRMHVVVKDETGEIDITEMEDSLVCVPVQIVKGLEVGRLRATTIKGDDMVDEGMAPGDIVIYDCGNVDSNGLYVIRLKTMIVPRRLEFSPVDNSVCIKSANSAYQDVTLDVTNENFQPLGKVVALLHKYFH